MKNAVFIIFFAGIAALEVQGNLQAKPIPECGAKAYITRADPLCGAKVARTKHCGVERYKKQESEACGINPNSKITYVPAPRHCLKADDSRPDRSCVDCPKKNLYVGMVSFSKKSDDPLAGIGTGALAISIPAKPDHLKCIAAPYYRSCEHKSHGVALFKECTHARHGYKVCSKREFGVAEYKDCAQYSREEILAWIEAIAPLVDAYGERLAKYSALAANAALNQRNMYCAMSKLLYSPLGQESFEELKKVYQSTFSVAFDEQVFDCDQAFGSGEESMPLMAEEDCSDAELTMRCHIRSELISARQDLLDIQDKAQSMAADVVATKVSEIKARLDGLLDETDRYLK